MVVHLSPPPCPLLGFVYSLGGGVCYALVTLYIPERHSLPSVRIIGAKGRVGVGSHLRKCYTKVKGKSR